MRKVATLMSKGRQIHCYDYVNHPYEQVRGALSKDAPAVFQWATKAAASRAPPFGGGIGAGGYRLVEGPATPLVREWT